MRVKSIKRKLLNRKLLKPLKMDGRIQSLQNLDSLIKTNKLLFRHQKNKRKRPANLLCGISYRLINQNLSQNSLLFLHLKSRWLLLKLRRF